MVKPGVTLALWESLPTIPNRDNLVLPAPPTDELLDAFSSLGRLRLSEGKELDPAGTPPAVIQGSKSSPAYLAHTYHTKVPPEVAESAIRLFTHPGDIVLDPFSGSGMTGVGALRAGRRAILVDLSPFAAFLSKQHNTAVDLAEFKRAAGRVGAAVAAEASWLYLTTCRACGLQARIEKTVWTEVIGCPSCDGPVRVYDAALGGDQRIHQAFACPNCKLPLRRGQGDRIGWEPAFVEVVCEACGRSRTDPSAEERSHLDEIERAGVPSAYWYPRDRIAWGDMWRRGYHQGIERISDFYTTRSLWMLAAIHHAIQAEKSCDLRNALLFVFTNLVWHGSRMRRFNARGGARPMNGALYIPAVFEEPNLFSVWRHKAEMVGRHLAHIRTFKPDSLDVAIGSATDLWPIPNESIDFVFTDPPYGGNILYSEVNLLWEAWLRARSSASEEVVVSRSQGKGVEEYRDLLTRSFAECHRVLRPGRWMTLTFNTSYAEIWVALQRALFDAGFEIHFVQVLDKGHRSFKQLTSATIAGYDVVVFCRKSSRTGRPKRQRAASPEEIAARARALRPPGRLDLRSLQELYAQVVASLLREGQLVGVSIRDLANLL